jgi:hypothetical protein
MTLKELEKFVTENFPNLISRRSSWNQRQVFWYHKDYPKCRLFHTGFGSADNSIWLYLPFKFISAKETNGTDYGITLPDSPVLPANEDGRNPYNFYDYRRWKLKEISEMTLKFHLIDLQQQYLRIRNEVLRTVESECQETCKG